VVVLFRILRGPLDFYNSPGSLVDIVLAHSGSLSYRPHDGRLMPCFYVWIAPQQHMDAICYGSCRAPLSNGGQVYGRLRCISLTFARLALGRKRRRCFMFPMLNVFLFTALLLGRTFSGGVFLSCPIAVISSLLSCLMHLLCSHLYAGHGLHLARSPSSCILSLRPSSRGFCYDNRLARWWSPGSEVRHHEFVHTSRSS
jgi:hypothetical protein